MVMHARKLPRLSDGYFDRNQSHSFENASKYSKSSDKVNEKVRESSINSNSENTGRNDGIDNRTSPRCHRSCSQRLKDKDHHDDTSNKSPVMKGENKAGIGSSNKELHKMPASIDSEGTSVNYQSNHDRNNAEESERRLQTGDWSEHISSSGKKYYYNCKTEISQWERPKELIESERQQSLCRMSYESNRAKDRAYDRQSGAGGSKNALSQDMDISPKNCEPYSCNTDSGLHNKNASYLPVQQSVIPQAAVQAHILSPSQVTLPNLPQLISQLAGTKGLPNLSELSPQEALRTIQQALQLTKHVTHLSQTVPDGAIQKSSSPAQSQSQVLTTNHHPILVQTNSNSQNSSLCQISSNSTTVSNLSIPQSLSESKTETDRGRTSPGSDCSTHSSRHGSPTSSVSSLQSLNATGTSSLATAALKPSIPSLTPSLANYYREDLISHVVGWQADHAERQANRYWEEGHNIGSLNCTQVSAELKMARALVRLAEIQATLQEQRILFLRQQTKELEDWRSLNSFMSDS